MKFVNLLKKELSELINKQMIIGLVVTMLIFMVLGNFMETTINEAVSVTYSVNLCDRDDTELTHELISMLEENNVELHVYSCESEDYAKLLNDNDIKSIVIIPEGFTDALHGDVQAELISVARMNSAAAMANISNDNSASVSLIEDCLKSILASEAGISSEQFSLMNSPITVSETTVVADKSASISLTNIMNKIMMQNMVLPIIVFVLIMMTSQMLMSAISTEKIDKTLETLLSAPISRTSVIGAKMLAAAIVALLNAAIYMIGFSTFVSGATDSVSEEFAQSAMSEYISVETALVQLGLSLSPADYILIGLQLFMTILICLSVSLILGAMINDTKSSQTMVLPLMMLAMIPYLISMMSDINSLPMTIRIIVYAIPFSHTFSAMSNLMFGNYTLFFGGLIYQVIVFAICMFFALRLFKSDKIFTISLNFGQKSKFKKNTANNQE